jgi:hypothetical protein
MTILEALAILEAATLFSLSYGAPKYGSIVVKNYSWR